MGWGPPECLREIEARDLRLRLVCTCGHSAEPDAAALRRLIYERHNDWWANLEDLRRYLRCGQCGGKTFRYEIGPSLRGVSIATDEP